MDDKPEVQLLLENAVEQKGLRTRFSQDRTAQELAESANRKGYSISEQDARKILAGAFLTSDAVSEELRNKLVGGLSWDYLKKVESALDGDFSLLADSDAWQRSLDFYLYVFADDEA